MAAFIGRAALTALVHSEVTLAQLKPATLLQSQHPTHDLSKPILSIRRQPHHFVLLPKFIEPDELAKTRIKEPEAVGQRHAIQYLDPLALAPGRQEAHEISRRVVRQAGRERFERR